MLRGLFLNTMPAACSIYESGKMIYDCLRTSEKFSLDYKEIQIVEDIPDGYQFLVFNYHHVTMAGMEPYKVIGLVPLKMAFVLEMYQDNPIAMCPQCFDVYCIPDPAMRFNDVRVFSLPRPLEDFDEEVELLEVSEGVAVIGSFGLMQHEKGYDRIIHAANEEFDRAIVRFNLPMATYTDQGGGAAKAFFEYAKSIAKQGIEIRMTHDYMSKQELIRWCAQNTINCFYYTRNTTGLAAACDQAIACGRPISVSDTSSFRHIHQYISPYPETPLKQSILETQVEVQKMKEAWSKKKFRERFEEILETSSSRRNRSL